MREWLRQARLDRSLTQAETAEAVGIAQNSYSNIENGARRPSPELAQRLGAVLGFRWTRFFEDEPGFEQTTN